MVANPPNSFSIHYTTPIYNVSPVDDIKRYYHDCHECFIFSMRFGNIFNHDEYTEEDFEIKKAEFIKHFNEKHKDLIQDKPKTSRKYVKTNKEIL